MPGIARQNCEMDWEPVTFDTIPHAQLEVEGLAGARAVPSDIAASPDPSNWYRRDSNRPASLLCSAPIAQFDLLAGSPTVTRPSSAGIGSFVESLMHVRQQLANPMQRFVLAASMHAKPRSAGNEPSEAPPIHRSGECGSCRGVPRSSTDSRPPDPLLAERRFNRSLRMRGSMLHRRCGRCSGCGVHRCRRWLRRAAGLRGAGAAAGKREADVVRLGYSNRLTITTAPVSSTEETS